MTTQCGMVKGACISFCTGRTASTLRKPCEGGVFRETMLSLLCVEPTLNSKGFYDSLMFLTANSRPMSYCQYLSRGSFLIALLSRASVPFCCGKYFSRFGLYGLGLCHVVFLGLGLKLSPT